MERRQRQERALTLPSGSVRLALRASPDLGEPVLRETLPGSSTFSTITARLAVAVMVTE